jgi:hypothetical protein
MGCQSPQLFDHRSTANIAGMNNMIHAMEMMDDQRIKQAVRIGFTRLMERD